MRIELQILLVSIVSVWADVQPSDCVDSRRTLRCVLPTNCPTKLLVNVKKCPTGRICCRKDKPNPYLPLRRVPDLQSAFFLRGRSLLDGDINDPRTDEQQDTSYEDRIIFPNDYEYEKNNRRSFRTGKDRFSFSNEEFLIDPPTQKDKEFNTDRKSEKFCREYAKLTIDVGYASLLLNKLVPLRYEMENCEPSVSPLVVGGSNVTISEFPHMVALGYNRNNEIEYLCGGSLISDEFVLTAAHCVETKWGSPIVVHMGATELHSKKAQRTLISKVYTHPDYLPPACYHDIALVKLSRRLKLTPRLRPACLPTIETAAQYPKNVAIATGWGRTGFARQPSINLQKVALKVIDNQKCGDYYKADISTPILHNGISQNMICAVGNTDSSEDTCQGDSGGPLQSYLPDNRCMLQIVGITSFGKSCGAGVPGVYTRIAPYLSWIENIVWPE